MAIPIPECPVCHKPTSLAGNQRYCSACGWNTAGAMAAARSSLFMLPLGVLMFVGFASFLIVKWHFRNKYQIAIFCIVPALAILINYISLRRSLGKLQALPEAARASAAMSATANAKASMTAAAIEPSAEDQMLLRASRPREIRMSAIGKVGVVGAVLMALGFAAAIAFRVHAVWARTESFARFHTGDWILLGFAVLLLLMPYGIWRAQVKECGLLENGEVAIARVTRQWRDDKNSYIECEYQDFMGQTRKCIGSDNSRKLYQGMTVPVFYDRENPRRQVAYCSTLHKVVV
jgi:hypothetical protein